MAPAFQIQERHGIYTPSYGSFGRISKTWGGNSVQWIKCRETFHYYADGAGDDSHSLHRYYFILYNPDNAMNLIGYVEDRLGIKDKTRFHYQENYSPKKDIHCNVLQVELSPFWKAQPMRHSFFTACLRASLESHGWDHLKTIKEYKVFASNHNAVDRFLAGHTWYTPNKDAFNNHNMVRLGWYNAFTPFQIGYSFVLEDILNKPNEQSIAERARQIWEQAKYPVGKDVDFWNQAKYEVTMT